MEAPYYNWECQVCGASNRAGLARCLTCGFPAVATGRAIGKAKRSLFPDSPEFKSQQPGLLDWLSSLVAPLPAWRKLIALASLIGIFFGWGLFQAAVSFRQAIAGIIVSIISVSVLGLAAAGKRKVNPPVGG